MFLLREMNEVEKEIEKVILRNPVDLQALRALSRKKGGFQSNTLRVRVWPKLMDVNRYNIVEFRQEIDPHRDDSQVQCDVERSLWNIEVVKNWKDSYRERRRQALSDIIMSIMCRNKGLHYYQGFHDVVSVFLLVFQDDHLAFAVAEKVALSFMIDFMQKDFELVCRFMKIVLVIVHAADPQLYDHLMEAKMEPFFATSWLITWFSHDIKNIEDVARLFDALLSSPPLYVYYLSAAYVIHLRSELLETEADFAMMHSTLARAPEKFGFPVEEMLASADKLMENITLQKVNSFCDSELLQLIKSKRIVSVARPCFTKHEIDSDWTLLENMRLVPRNSWTVANKMFRVLWCHGWNLTFLSPSRLRTLEQQSTMEQQQQQQIRKIMKQTAEKMPKKREEIARKVSLSFFDLVLNALDEVMYVVFVRFRRFQAAHINNGREFRTLLRFGLFWSITFAVGGSIAYSYLHHGKPQDLSGTCAAGDLASCKDL